MSLTEVIDFDSSNISFKDGMVRMDNSILELYNDGAISQEQALNYAINTVEMQQKLRSANI